MNILNGKFSSEMVRIINSIIWNCSLTSMMFDVFSELDSN